MCSLEYIKCWTCFSDKRTDAIFFTSINILRVPLACFMPHHMTKQFPSGIHREFVLYIILPLSLPLSISPSLSPHSVLVSPPSLSLPPVLVSLPLSVPCLSISNSPCLPLFSLCPSLSSSPSLSLSHSLLLTHSLPVVKRTVFFNTSMFHLIRFMVCDRNGKFL